MTSVYRLLVVLLLVAAALAPTGAQADETIRGESACGDWEIRTDTDPSPGTWTGTACDEAVSMGGYLQGGYQIQNLSVGLATMSAGDVPIAGSADRIIEIAQAIFDIDQDLVEIGKQAWDFASCALEIGEAVEVVTDLGTREMNVDACEVEFEFGFVNVDKLDVQGALFVIGGFFDFPAIDTKEAIVDGGVFATGDFEARTLSMDGTELLPSFLFMSGDITTNTTTSNDSVIYAGGLSAPRRFEAVDALMSLPKVTGGLVRMTDSSLAGTEVVASERLIAGQTSFDGHDTLRAQGMQLRGGSVSGAPELLINAATSLIDKTSITSAHIVGRLGRARVIGGATFDATGGGKPGLSLPYNESGTGFQEAHYGRSYGGYGGSAANMNQNRFEPAREHSGSATNTCASGSGQTCSGFGLGGYGFYYDPGNVDTGEGGGTGGGWIEITADSLTWSGKAVANGNDAPTHRPADPNNPNAPLREGGGGSGGTGGSIEVNVDGDLTGNGTFHSNGGDGTFGSGLYRSNFSGGGGSGGRIVVKAGAFVEWRGKSQAIGGLGGVVHPDFEDDTIPPWLDWRAHGGPGTTYWKDAGKPGTIVIDGAGFGGLGFDGANQGEGLGGGLPATDRSGVRLGHGLGELSGSYAGDNVVIKNATVLSDGLTARSIKLEDSILTADEPRLRLHWLTPDETYEGGVLGVGQALYPEWLWAEPLEESLTVRTSGNVEVGEDSRIDLSGLGGYARDDPIPETNGNNWAGGSYGGEGGRGRIGNENSLGQPSPTFGNPRQPDDFGLGGFGRGEFTGEEQNLCALGGSGGGALRLNVGGRLEVDGSVRSEGANGRDGSRTYCDSRGTGGGAGGSLWVVADAVRGAGKLSVAGGDGGFEDRGSASSSAFGGGGGGGRVAVYAGSVIRRMLIASGGKGGTGYDVPPSMFAGKKGSIFVGD